MAGRTKREIRDQDVQGVKCLRKIRPLLSRLRKVGTERDRAGNRRLFMDQYCALILMALFSPAIESLRDLQRACALDKVRKRLGVNRASLGSLSESVAVFDPAPLKEIAAELGHTIRSRPDRRFDSVGQRITAVDGTVIETVKRVAELSWTPKAKGKHLSAYRLHTHFEVLGGKAVRIDATPASPKGDGDERAVLQRTIEADRCYILDRGYISYRLWNAINAAGSSYVCRSSDRILATVTHVNELTEADRAANVISDEIVDLGWKSRHRIRPDHPVRLVCVAVKPHGGCGSMRGPTCDGVLRLVTNRLDLPAELIAEMYRLRWVIEMFFRTFKQLLGCRHLFSSDHNGVEIQAYCAMIVCMLILLYTGEKPNRAMYQMVWYYLIGLASLKELAAFLAAALGGVACALERRRRPAETWMSERSRLRVSEGPEGRSERPPRGHGQPRPTQDADSPARQPPCRTGLESARLHMQQADYRSARVPNFTGISVTRERLLRHWLDERHPSFGNLREQWLPPAVRQMETPVSEVWLP